MAANDYFTKRINYYNGQFLLSNDFIDQQAYHENRQQLHARMQHVWGITEGLGVTITPTNAKAVDVAPGAAVDGSGRLILLAAPATTSMPSGIAAGAHAVVIAFAETPTDPADAKYVPGYTRLTQTPSISVKPFSTVAPPEIVLATLTVDANGTITQVDTSARTYSGLRLIGPSNGGFDLRTKDDDSLVVERFAEGDTSFTRLLTITNTGNVGIGAAPPSGALLAVGTSGQLQVSASGALTLSDLTGVLKGNGASAVSAMTGTANKAARWTDASTLGTGAIFDDGTKVGIGAASSGAPLAVAGIVHSTTGGFKFPDGSIQTTAVNPSAVVPSGVILMWSGSVTSIPAGWALCNGTNNTPDLRDRFIVGAGNSYSVGATGGEAQHTLTVSEMPSHSHVIPASVGTDDKNFSDAGRLAHSDTGLANASDVNTQSAGGSQPHENRPPYHALCYIMKL